MKGDSKIIGDYKYMEMKFTVEQRQKISARQQQAASILQMGRMELDTFLSQAVLENPLLEYDETRKETYEEHDIVERIEWLEETDKQNIQYYKQDYANQEGDIFASVGTEENEGLEEYLFSQFYTYPLDEKQKAVLEYLILSLDERGYFTESVEETAEVLKTQKKMVEDMLALLKTAEPAGIGAENLQECLLLQLDRKGWKAPVARKIILEYLDLLGKNQLSVLAKKLDITMKELLENFKVIQELNPKPGNGFSYREHLKYLKPDITVVKFADRFEIMLNEASEQVSINAYYSRMLKMDVDDKTKTYIREKLNQARWTIQCVLQRNETLSAVAKILVEQQEGFFTYGKGYLLPLSMQEVADILGIHESTVSRAVKDKYLQCTWGIYPMSYFFCRKIKEGKSVASTAMFAKEQLRKLIEQEDKRSPASDQKLVQLLKEEGIEISRRTVAKYREELGIPEKGKRRIFE